MTTSTDSFSATLSGLSPMSLALAGAALAIVIVLMLALLVRGGQARREQAEEALRVPTTPGPRIRLPARRREPRTKAAG